MAEADLYDLVQSKLAECFSSVTDNCLTATTASTGFSEILKAAIPSQREIVFAFMELKPDIVGYVKRPFGYDLVTVEIKEDALTIHDVYQAKKYKEVFGARYAFLISPLRVPEKLKRLCSVAPSILRSPNDGSYSFLVMGQYHPTGFLEWFPTNPFLNEFYWK